MQSAREENEGKWQHEPGTIDSDVHCLLTCDSHRNVTSLRANLRAIDVTTILPSPNSSTAL